MPTVHFRKGKESVVLFEAPETLIPGLVPELAEVLIYTKLASQDEVSNLRLGVQREDEFVDITESDASIKDLEINEYSVVCFKFGSDAEFEYDEYASKA